VSEFIEDFMAPTPCVPLPIRVVIVDDSAFTGIFLQKHLNTTDDIRVIGLAQDGQAALDLIAALRPDVAILDINMTGLDGLTTLQMLMAKTPIPVVMFSSMTTQGARETIQALMFGAVDFVTKPGALSDLGSVIKELAQKIRQSAHIKVKTAAPQILPEMLPMKAHPNKASRLTGPEDKLVVIGASTGGPSALKMILSGLPGDLPAAVLVVQHMPPGFTHSLAKRLGLYTSLAVKEADRADTLLRGQVLIAPGGYHMTVQKSGEVILNQNKPVHGVRPAIDVTMVSAVQHYGSGVVGVVLTGMGKDGTLGATLIHQSGGIVIVEDESTAAVWSMPRHVIESGSADHIRPLPEIARSIERAVNA
jgi:two-component system chemotaxis response regulator CheB